MTEPTEPEILDGRRGFAEAQDALGRNPTGPPVSAVVGWHDTVVHPERGYFAVVGRGRGFDELIGEVVKVYVGEGEGVSVYVIGSRPVPVDLSLARRAFVHVESLQVDSADAIIRIV